MAKQLQSVAFDHGKRLLRTQPGSNSGTTIRTKSAALVRQDAAFCISAFGALHFQFAH